eukprot:6237401-Pyramimonas_sp.AAC.3
MCPNVTSDSVASGSSCHGAVEPYNPSLREEGVDLSSNDKTTHVARLCGGRAGARRHAPACEPLQTLCRICVESVRTLRVSGNVMQKSGETTVGFPLCIKVGVWLGGRTNRRWNAVGRTCYWTDVQRHGARVALMGEDFFGDPHRFVVKPTPVAATVAGTRVHARARSGAFCVAQEVRNPGDEAEKAL